LKAACAYFRKCSGCTKLAFPYVKQVRDKEQQIRRQLARFAGPGGEAAPVFQTLVTSPLPLGYRASTKLCLAVDAFGRRAIGLYERASKHVVDIPNCPVHHPEINRLLARLLAGNVPLPAPFYNHEKRSFQPGCLKFVTIRLSPERHQAGIVLSHTGVDRRALEDWARRLDTRNLAVYEATLRKTDADLVLSEDVRHLAGLTHVPYVVAGRELQLDPLAFFQANFALTGPFVEHITADLAGQVLLDLYGGFGAYSFSALAAFARVYLVDGNAHAIEAAQRANAVDGIAGLTPVHAYVENFLTTRLAAAERARVTHVIVNPPRGGLSSKACQLLARRQLPAIERLTYVSCNPETLTRDLAALTGPGGYTAESITPFDMFPQTEHVEVVCKLVPTRQAMRPADASTRPKPTAKSK